MSRCVKGATDRVLQAWREEGALHSCSLFALQLSETTAESHLMEKELEELKTHSRRRK